MTTLRVSELNIYPIKSARGLSVDSVQLNSKGPDCDRRWMVVDSNNSFVTQRKFPKMCLIDTKLIDDQLFISSIGYDQCRVPAGGASLISSVVWGTDVMGEDCGDHAAQWISKFLGKECRIIYMQDNYTRLVDTDFAKQNETVGFADGFPLLVTTEASLEDFNSKSDLEIGMDRFRPNVVISGNMPWAEDEWQQISIGGIELTLAKPCSRCIMPSVDPETAEKQMQVNQALLTHRRRDKKTYFGQNALYNSFGTIRVGDEVTIIK